MKGACAQSICMQIPDIKHSAHIVQTKVLSFRSNLIELQRTHMTMATHTHTVIIHFSGIANELRHNFAKVLFAIWIVRCYFEFAKLKLRYTNHMLSMD